MHLFLEQLDNLGFLQGSRPNLEKIKSAKLVELGDLVQESVALTSAKDIPRARGIFEYSVSRSFGGGEEPCAGLDCRERRTEELARFSALYADKVYVHNFFADRIHSLKSPKLSLAQFRVAIATDLMMIAMLRPLIENGIVVPVSPPNIGCPFCFASENLGEIVGNKFAEADAQLRVRLIEEASVTLLKRKNGYVFEVDAPEDIIEHRVRRYQLENFPSKLKRYKRLFERVELGESVQLTKKQTMQIDLYNMIADRLVCNTALDVCVSQAIGTTYVTNSKIHVDVLNNISTDLGMSRRNRIVSKYLTSIVPIAADVPVSNLVALRKRESDAFVLFRSALNKAVDQYQSAGDTFTEADARTIYSETILPGVAQLNRRVASAKKGLTASIRGKVSAISAFFSFGGFAGLGTQGALGAAKSLGLGAASNSLVETLGGARDASSTIETESLFFLWKLKHTNR